MRKLVLLAIIALAVPVCSQQFNVERDRVQMASLDGLMRFHTGDDPDGTLGWSRPDFDDSGWPLISSEHSWSEQGYKDYSGFAWYRFDVVLTLEHRQLGLYIPGILTSYEVFADGNLVASFGGFPPKATAYKLHHHLVMLPPTNSGHMQIAIRVWHWPQWASYSGGGIAGVPRIGDADQLKEWLALQDKNTFWQLSAQGYLALLNFLYAAAGFALFLMRRKERLYLWYGLAGLFFCTWSLLNLFDAFRDMPIYVSEALPSAVAVAGFFSFVVFIWMMLGVKDTFWVWVCAGSVALNVLMWTLPPLLSLPTSVGSFILLVVNLPMMLGPGVMLIQGFRRGNPDARLLLIPVGLNILANWINDILWVMLTTGHTWVRPVWAFWSETFDWPFPFGLYDLSIGILLIAILAIVVLRFARSRQEEEQLNNEFDAARTVQRVLIPEQPPQIPGFRIETAYKPARHVGGDFFYVQPQEHDGVLLVIGDVSGKGLRAALAVNLVIGALRTMPALPPARILAALNRGLVDQLQGGFVTCCVARIGCDGTATIANAGHLAPYLDSEEIELPAAFPLGITTEAVFEESSVVLPADARLTLITDGVVEARDASGELFGFHRTASIATESAQDIADAASNFGQDDDITVLTLTREAILEPASAEPETQASSLLP